MIERQIIPELLDSMSYFPVLGLVGPRQVGKTTLAKYVSDKVGKESVYIDLENPRDIAKLSDPNLFFELNEDKCVILDEIQRQPELFVILRSMVDRNRIPGRFLILGSASPELIRDSSESLAGRIAYEELAPFNLMEIISTGDLIHHWISGGFPNAYLAPNKRLQKKWLQNFIKTYIERDLPMLGLKIDTTIIRKLWTMTAHLQGNLLNLEALGKSLALTAPTIKRYLSFLEEAFLIRQLHPFSINIKKRLVKSPKIYVRDSGILHHLLGIDDFESLTSNPIIGHSWEGYVIEQIYQLVRQDYDLFFYRTTQGAECDLVLVKSGIPHYGIEIKYTSAPKLTKGNRIAFEDLKTKKNFVITPNSDDFLITENIRACSIQTFLDKYLE